MKKRILSLALFAALSFSVTAQTDGFFYNEYKENNETRAIDPPGRGMGKAYFFAEGSKFEQFIEESVPVGDGLLILIGAGLCYVINKRNRKERTI